MKIEIPDELYYKLLQDSMKNKRSINEQLQKVFERYMNLDIVYENLNDEQINTFRDILHSTIEEILISQKDLAESDEGSELDLKMMDVLNILLARATRDKDIMSECMEEFFKG